MKDQKADVLKGYFEKLSSANPMETIGLLKKIEKAGKDVPGTAGKLIPLLDHPDYLVRSRVFIALGRIKDSGVGELLLDYLATEAGEEWQLRVLDVLYQLNDRGAVSRLSLLLEQHQMPLLTRGATWLLGFLGGEEALHALLGFAVRPQGRIVKSEMIYEGIALALKSLGYGEEYWTDLTGQNTPVGRFFRYSKLPEIDAPRFSVYPYPDYLLDQAIARGIRPKEFKKLYHWEREV